MKKIRRSMEQKLYGCRNLRKKTHIIENSFQEVKAKLDDLEKKIDKKER